MAWAGLLRTILRNVRRSPPCAPAFRGFEGDPAPCCQGLLRPTLSPVSTEDEELKNDLEKLRRDGSVVVRFDSAEDVAQWRAAMRKACRAAGLRHRTGLANADDRIAWALHVDHVVTEAEHRAASRAIQSAYDDDEPRVPFHELVRDEQRKMLRVVRDGEG